MKWTSGWVVVELFDGKRYDYTLFIQGVLVIILALIIF